jgi:hypothetical protein
MVCQHLLQLDEELSRHGIEVIYRDWQPWGQNCRNWTRFACYLELSALRARLKLADCVVDHVFRGTFQGDERGFVCHEHWDAIIGDYERCSDRPVVQ